MSTILTIWFKELKDTIRDKRTLFSMIIMPMVLMPLLIVGMAKFQAWQMSKAEGQTVKIGITNASSSPMIADTLMMDFRVEIEYVKENIDRLVKEKKIDLGIYIPEDYEKSVSGMNDTMLYVFKNSTNEKSALALNKVNGAITIINANIQKQRLKERDLDPKLTTKVFIRVDDMATPREIGGLVLGFILPMFIVMWSIIGGQYTAIDVSAGEKERKTLEPLLLTPASRMEIVFGKFLAVATAALSSVIVSLASMSAAFRYFGLTNMPANPASAGTEIGKLNFHLDPAAIFLFLAVGFLLVLMFSAVILSISIFARSFKEAQSYIGPAYLIVILPIVLINTMPSFQPGIWFYAIPAANAVMLFKELLLGIYNGGHIILTIVSLLLFSFIAIYAAARIYQQEKVLFKE